MRWDQGNLGTQFFRRKTGEKLPNEHDYRLFCLFRKNRYSVNFAAIGNCSFRNQNRSQKNTITANYVYSNSGIVPRTCPQLTTVKWARVNVFIDLPRLPIYCLSVFHSDWYNPLAQLSVCLSVGLSLTLIATIPPPHISYCLFVSCLLTLLPIPPALVPILLAVFVIIPRVHTLSAFPVFRLGPKFRNHRARRAWMGAHLPFRTIKVFLSLWDKHAIMPPMRIAVCFDGRIIIHDHIDFPLTPFERSPLFPMFPIPYVLFLVSF